MNPPQPESPPRDQTLARAKERYLRNRQRDANAPWREWLRDRYARYWYIIGCLFLALVIAETIIMLGPPPTQLWQYGAASLAVVVLAFFAIKGYLRLWPPKPEGE